MDPSSLEAQEILQHYKVTYNEAIFYETHHQTGKYLLLSGIAIMLWDHITTLQDEIRYIWQMKGRWTIATVLFGFNRYISPLGFISRFIQLLRQNPDQPMCGLSKLAAYLNIVSFACVEIVLMLRVWVMYGKSKKIGLFLGAVFFVTLGISLILPTKQPPRVTSVIPPLPMSLVLCVRSYPSTYFWLLIIALSVGTTTFSLFCVKVCLARKDSITTPILSALVTQGAAYYVVVLCAFAVSIPATMYGEMFISLMDLNITILVPCIACSRLILSLRGLYYSRMVVGPTVLSTLINGEERRVMGVSLPHTPARSLDTPVLATHDKVEDDWVCVGPGDLSIGLENLARERRDSTGLRRPTVEKIATV